jgi:phosphoserine phosphatase
VYGERMARVRPGRDDLAALATAYRDALAPGAESAVARLRAAGVYVAIVSGGLRQAIVPVARMLGLTLVDVHAVDVVTDGGGQYVGYDAGSPLGTQAGKHAVVREVLAARGAAAHPALAVGDGSTDVSMRGDGACAAFAAYTGFTRRDAVVARADHVLADFDALVALVLGRRRVTGARGAGRRGRVRDVLPPGPTEVRPAILQAMTRPCSRTAAPSSRRCSRGCRTGCASCSTPRARCT